MTPLPAVNAPGILGIDTARVFVPLLAPHRYKGAHGGRGSGKSHFFAGLMVEMAEAHHGFRGVCIREVQKDLRDSAKKLIEDKIEQHGRGRAFRIQDNHIKTPGGGVIIFHGMQDHTAESIKSLEGFDVAWVEEAQTLSQNSLTLLRPTIREEKSELWFSWNRTRMNDPVDIFLTQDTPPTDSAVVMANWRDNPWFPSVLEQERHDDEVNRPDEYGHIWEGEYAKVLKGAYYAQALREARQQGRIGRVARDPLMRLRACWDLGRDDATAIWIWQAVGREIRILDYIEGRGQHISYYVNELNRKGYSQALCVLPHDGKTENLTSPGSAMTQLKAAGFDVEVIPNQGKGAAMQRVEASRRLFPQMWFNEATTEAGVLALGAYHAKVDDKRNVDLGPEHDWASDPADAFGLIAIAYKPPEVRVKPDRYRHEDKRSSVSFMGV